MIKIIFTLLSVLIFLLFPINTFAANFGLSVEPPLLKVSIRPGKSITQVFKLTNLSDDDKLFVARIVPFKDADNYGNPVIIPDAKADWISYFSLLNANIKYGEPFPIKSNSSEQLIVGLTVPETAKSEDIYATLLISTYINATDIGYQGSSVNASVASNMLITINQQEFPDTILKIEKFFPIDGTFIKIGNFYLADNITPLIFSSMVKNDGDYTADTKGVFRVTTGSDKPIYLDGILPVNIISKTTRVITSTGGDSFKFSPEMGNLGFHKISLEIKTDNSNTSNSITIILLPIKLGLGIAIVSLIIFTILKTTSKKQSFEIDTIKNK